jgi:hypothetical protein
MSTRHASTVILFRARVAMALRDPKDAAVAFQELGRRDGGLAQRGLYGWAQALLASGTPGPALDCFERYANSYPAGDYLAGALAGATRSGERTRKTDRAAASRARLAMAAPTSFEAADLPPAPRAPAIPSSKTPAPVPGNPAPDRSGSAGSPSATRLPVRQLPAVAPPFSAGAGPAYIQLGLFGRRANAAAVVDRARAAGLAASIDSIPGAGAARYLVRGSSHDSREAAVRAAQRYHDAGLATQLKQGGR